MAPENDQPFPELYIRFSEVEPTRPESNLNDGHLCRIPRIQWIPSDRKNGFRRGWTWGWHRYEHACRPGENTFTRVFSQHDTRRLPSHIVPYETRSMFYSTELNTFLHVPYDCTHVDAEDYSTHEGDRWNRITFGRPERVTEQYPNLWIMGHALSKTQMDANVFITDSWDSLILPGSFENGIQQRNRYSTCDLAGKLTMILGVVAFATSPDDLINMIRESFRAPSTSHYVPVWARQPRREKDRGLINKRGLIIEIAFDSVKYKREEIIDWEKGCHGPILTSNPEWNIRHNEPATAMPFQPALQYAQFQNRVY